MLPAASSHTAPGLFSSAEAAAPPSPESPPVPAELPATVYTKSAVMFWPNSAGVGPAASCTPLLAGAAVDLLPVGSPTATGEVRVGCSWGLVSLPAVQV